MRCQISRGETGTRDGPVGVDIQRIDPKFPWRQVADEVLSVEEMARFLALPDELQQAEFYRYWVMKEAISKAAGVGLARPFPSFSLSDCANWASGHIRVGSGYLAAWAMEAGERESTPEGLARALLRGRSFAADFDFCG